MKWDDTGIAVCTLVRPCIFARILMHMSQGRSTARLYRPMLYLVSQVPTLGALQ